MLEILLRVPYDILIGFDSNIKFQFEKILLKNSEKVKYFKTIIKKKNAGNFTWVIQEFLNYVF